MNPILLINKYVNRPDIVELPFMVRFLALQEERDKWLLIDAAMRVIAHNDKIREAFSKIGKKQKERLLKLIAALILDEQIEDPAFSRTSCV